MQFLYFFKSKKLIHFFQSNKIQVFSIRDRVRSEYLRQLSSISDIVKWVGIRRRWCGGGKGRKRKSSPGCKKPKKVKKKKKMESGP